MKGRKGSENKEDGAVYTSGARGKDRLAGEI